MAALHSLTESRDDPNVPTSDRGQALTNGALLARNAIWSIVGRAAPLLIALISIPILIHGLGTAKYGVLNLGWVVVGYLNLFDFGLGRALTMVVAEKLGTDQEREVAPLFWKAMLSLVMLGAIGALVGLVLSRWLAYSILTIPDGMKVETLHVFYLLSLWLPVQISESGLRGLLEAHQKFKLLGTLSMLMGVFSYLAPVSLLLFTHRLTIIIGVILLARGILWITLLIQCLQTLPAENRFSLRGSVPIRSLLQVGGWMTISNILSPLMDFSDRFLIGALLSVSAVAFYTAPFDLVIKMMIVPTAIASVIFPAFATNFGTARNKAADLFSRTIRTTYIVLLPVTIVVILFAKELLSLWLGRSFADSSTHVFQILAFGMLAKCVAEIPVALVQGGGRADLYAQLHMAEFPVYLLLMWMLVRPYGIDGAAIAWSCRAILDAAMLLIFSQRMLTHRMASTLQLLGIVAGTTAILALCAAPWPFAAKVLVFLTIIAGVAFTSFTRLISDEERRMLLTWVDTINLRYLRKGATS